MKRKLFDPNYAYYACFAPSCTATYAFILKGKIVIRHLLEWCVYEQITEEKRRKKQHRAGIKPTTFLLQDMRSTAVRQPLPNVNLVLSNQTIKRSFFIARIEQAKHFIFYLQRIVPGCFFVQSSVLGFFPFMHHWSILLRLLPPPPPSLQPKLLEYFFLSMVSLNLAETTIHNNSLT